MRKIHFMTFGGPNPNYHDAVVRLCNQARGFEIFDTITAYTEKDLITDTEFWDKHGDFISRNNRGFGYWIWKPYLIHKKLTEIDDDDILLYLDCGCELNIHGKKRLLELVDITVEKLIIGTETYSNDVHWTKRDLANHMMMDSHPTLIQNHMQAGAIMMLKCKKIVDLYNEFYTICCNHTLIDDTPSVISNHSGFIEHRHDQSVFNLLVKKYNLVNYDIDPSQWGNGYHYRNKYLSEGISHPIWYCRNKSGKSLFD